MVSVAQRLFQDVRQHPAGCGCPGLVAERDLRQLDVPIAEVAPDKLVEPVRSLSEIEHVHFGGHVACCAGQTRQNPSVEQSELIIGRTGTGQRLLDVVAGVDEARCIPQLVDEVPRRQQLLVRE